MKHFQFYIIFSAFTTIAGMQVFSKTIVPHFPVEDRTKAQNNNTHPVSVSPLPVLMFITNIPQPSIPVPSPCIVSHATEILTS